MYSRCRYAGREKKIRKGACYPGRQIEIVYKERGRERERERERESESANWRESRKRQGG